MYMKFQFRMIVLLFSLATLFSCKKSNDNNSPNESATKPKLTTTAITEIKSYRATAGGNITSDGGSSIIERGVCWNTLPNPNYFDKKAISGTGIGSFTATLNGLTCGTKYFVRAFAINETDTAYGNELSFTVPSGAGIFNPNLTYGTVTDIDQNTYKTIKIGTQEWMAENLRVTQYNDGTIKIPLVSQQIEWENNSSSASFGGLKPMMCWVKDDINLSKTLGALYNMFAVVTEYNGGKNVCPVGWHVPSQTDWATLSTFLGGDEVAGDKLRNVCNDFWIVPNLDATNESGFSALPAGMRYARGLDGFIPTGAQGKRAYFWATTPLPDANINDADPRPVRELRMDRSTFSFFDGTFRNENGASVRCVKD